MILNQVIDTTKTFSNTCVGGKGKKENAGLNMINAKLFIWLTFSFLNSS